MFTVPVDPMAMAFEVVKEPLIFRQTAVILAVLSGNTSAVALMSTRELKVASGPGEVKSTDGIARLTLNDEFAQVDTFPVES